MSESNTWAGVLNRIIEADLDSGASRLLFNIVVLVTAMLSSIQIASIVHVGGLKSPENASALFIGLLLLGSALFAYLVQSAVENLHFTSIPTSTARQFGYGLLALLISVGLLILLVPGVSLLFVLIFGVIALLAEVALILVPDALLKNSNATLSLKDNIMQLYERRHLIGVWASYRIRARYIQTKLGLFWIILYPVLESLVLALVFSQLLGRGGANRTPWVMFFLTGKIIFLIFQKMVNNGRIAIRNTLSIIKQVYFPREIIVFLLAVEVMVDFVFAFSGMLLIGLAYGVLPNINYLFLPLPILMLLALSIGTTFIVAWICLLIPDLQHIVMILLQLLFYITIFIDTNQQLAGFYRYITIVNPLSGIVGAFRGVILYNQPPDLTSLFIPLLFAIILLYIGYVFYKANEDRFADF